MIKIPFTAECWPCKLRYLTRFADVPARVLAGVLARDPVAVLEAQTRVEYLQHGWDYRESEHRVQEAAAAILPECRQLIMRAMPIYELGIHYPLRWLLPPSLDNIELRFFL